MKRIASIILVLIIISGIGSYAQNSHHLQIMERIIYIVFTLLAVLGLFLLQTWFYRCPNCKKMFAMAKGQTFLAESENIHIAVENKTRNLEGKVIGTQEQHVPGKRETYITVYTCKFCGNNKNVGKTYQKANV